MAEYQVTYWRELPSLVVARGERPESGPDDVTKSPLAPRFQEAIDEAAMRLDATDSDAYLAGWWRTEWVAADGTPTEVADRVVSDLESRWTDEALAAYLGGLAQPVTESEAEGHTHPAEGATT